jgi:hypothetical protein
VAQRPGSGTYFRDRFANLLLLKILGVVARFPIEDDGDARDRRVTVHPVVALPAFPEQDEPRVPQVFGQVTDLSRHQMPTTFPKILYYPGAWRSSAFDIASAPLCEVPFQYARSGHIEAKSGSVRA